MAGIGRAINDQTIEAHAPAVEHVRAELRSVGWDLVSYELVGVEK